MELSKIFLALSKTLKERGKETSTWRGIVLMLTAMGVSIDQSQQEAIITFGLAVAGAMSAFLPDNLE